MLPPLDWDKVGTDTWGDVVKQIRKVGIGTFFHGLLSKDNEKKSLLQAIRDNKKVDAGAKFFQL